MLLFVCVGMHVCAVNFVCVCVSFVSVRHVVMWLWGLCMCVVIQRFICIGVFLCVCMSASRLCVTGDGRHLFSFGADVALCEESQCWPIREANQPTYFSVCACVCVLILYVSLSVLVDYVEVYLYLCVFLCEYFRCISLLKQGWFVHLINS